MPIWQVHSGHPIDCSYNEENLDLLQVYGQRFELVKLNIILIPVLSAKLTQFPFGLFLTKIIITFKAEKVSYRILESMSEWSISWTSFKKGSGGKSLADSSTIAKVNSTLQKQSYTTFIKVLLPRLRYLDGHHLQFI